MTDDSKMDADDAALNIDVVLVGAGPSGDETTIKKTAVLSFTPTFLSLLPIRIGKPNSVGVVLGDGAKVSVGGSVLTFDGDTGNPTNNGVIEVSYGSLVTFNGALHGTGPSISLSVEDSQVATNTAQEILNVSISTGATLKSNSVETQIHGNLSINGDVPVSLSSDTGGGNITVVRDGDINLSGTLQISMVDVTIDRTGGTASIASGTMIILTDDGGLATNTDGGSIDPLTETISGNSVNIVNDSDNPFVIGGGNITVESLTGVGSTVIDTGATLTVNTSPVTQGTVIVDGMLDATQVNISESLGGGGTIHLTVDCSLAHH